VVFMQLTLGLFLKICATKAGIPYTLIITLVGGIIGYFYKDLG
jgi:phosphate/sulfate permease